MIYSPHLGGPDEKVIGNRSDSHAGVTPDKWSVASSDENEYTVNDPSTFVRPWTAQIPMSKTEGPIWEYACHEGNYAMTNVLTGARAEEKAAADAAAKGGR